MLQLIQDGAGLRLSAEGRIILEDIVPEIRMDGEPAEDLAFAGSEETTGRDFAGEYRERSIRYADEERGAALTLRCRSYGTTALVYVDAALDNTYYTKRPRYFAPENGIVLRVGGIGDVRGLMANYRHKFWWTRPHFDPDVSRLPHRTQSMLWSDGESYAHLLPICDEVYRCDLGGNGERMTENGPVAGTGRGFSVRLSAGKGGIDRCRTLAFVLSVGGEPSGLFRDNASAALRALDRRLLRREERRYPEMLEYVGWCSWDAFRQEVSEQGILDKADDWKACGLPLKWIIVDDGWLDENERRLRSFGPDPVKFPSGFASLTNRLKRQYGLEWVGVWQALTGYWHGIDPDGSLARSDMRRYLHETNNGTLLPSLDEANGFGFWSAWHAELKRDGIDFVKVDSQSTLTNYTGHSMTIGEAASGAHRALDASVGLHFDGCLINCMGMAVDNIWHRPASPISRNSGDFMPMDADWFSEHALQNVYNAPYHGELYWCDYDMFWTKHPDGMRHAVLRAVSGGPVYISDKPGETDPSVLWPLMLRTGRILRCDRPGVPTGDTLLCDPTREAIPLKVWNRSGNAGIVAAFHIHEAADRVQATVGPSDVPGLNARRYAVLDHFGQRVHALEAAERLPISLERGETGLYTFVPFEGSFAVFGLVDKYIGSAAVVSRDTHGGRTFVRLAEGGVFGFAADREPARVLVNGKEVAPRLRDALYTVDCSACADPVLVELEAGLQPEAVAPREP